jgi:hypothetical protein
LDFEHAVLRSFGTLFPTVKVLYRNWLEGHPLLPGPAQSWVVGPGGEDRELQALLRVNIYWKRDQVDWRPGNVPHPPFAPKALVKIWGNCEQCAINQQPLCLALNSAWTQSMEKNA